MPVHGPDVAILIPAFGRKTQTMCAVRTALSSSAGEIIVSLDTDPEQIAHDLSALQDVRLRVVVQPRRLGLWPNHLALLRETRRPFVKFLQTDDCLLAGGLDILCEAFDSRTAVVSGLPYYTDLEAGHSWLRRTPTTPGRWTSEDYLRRAEVTGNELGRPSYTLFRKDVIPVDEWLWRDEMSADWAVNLIAASRGDVALVAHGAVVCGVHAAQDGATQGPELVTRRLVNTLEALRERFGQTFHTLVSCQAAAAMVTIAHNSAGFIKRGRNPMYRGVLNDLRRLARLIDRRALCGRPGLSRALDAVAFRYSGRTERLIEP